MHPSHRLYERAPVGLCYLDAKLRYLQVNRWLADLNGVPVDEHIGRAIHDVIPQVARRVAWSLKDVIDTGVPVIGGRVTAETPARPTERRTFEHDYYPDLTPNGRSIGLSCVVWEVTAHPERSVRNMLRLSETETSVSRLLSVLHYIVSESGDAVSGPTSARLPQDPMLQPTAREYAVLMAFVSNASIQETAARLHLSKHTVKNHLKALFRKYGVNSAVELVCSALGTLGQDLV